MAAKMAAVMAPKRTFNFFWIFISVIPVLVPVTLAAWFAHEKCINTNIQYGVMNWTLFSKSWDHVEPGATMIRNSIEDLIQSTWARIDELEDIRQKNSNTPPYEVGFLYQLVQDKYRKMVDKYKTACQLDTLLYIFELIIYVEEVEHGYWQLDHILAMAHEIERKYGVPESDEPWVDLTRAEEYNRSLDKRWKHRTKLTTLKKRKGRKRKITPVNPNAYTHATPKPPITQTTAGMYRTKPMNETILENAPWSVKLLLLKEVNAPTTIVQTTTLATFRRVGIEALVARRQEGPPSEEPELSVDDDNNMRLKLFRLMYETVRDSDLKVKRAELIRKHYTNSTAFEVGFLMGEVQEKFDVITEFAGTLQKFYDVWKPIEHINAYEQIANYAIQINHLIDLIKSISKNTTLTF